MSVAWVILEAMSARISGGNISRIVSERPLLGAIIRTGCFSECDVDSNGNLKETTELQCVELK